MTDFIQVKLHANLTIDRKSFFPVETSEFNAFSNCQMRKFIIVLQSTSLLDLSQAVAIMLKALWQFELVRTC